MTQLPDTNLGALFARLVVLPQPQYVIVDRCRYIDNKLRSTEETKAVQAELDLVRRIHGSGLHVLAAIPSRDRELVVKGIGHETAEGDFRERHIDGVIVVVRPCQEPVEETSARYSIELCRNHRTGRATEGTEIDTQQNEVGNAVEIHVDQPFELVIADCRPRCG